MENIYVWIAFFGAPLLLLAITAFVYRPGARKDYHAAKMIPFEEIKRNKT